MGGWQVFDSIQELVDKADKKNLKISDIVLRAQSTESGKKEELIINEMKDKFEVMKNAVNEGLSLSTRSSSGLSGGDARKFINAVKKGVTVEEGVFEKTIAYALAVAELNACMGRIVAAPTAGSCGIVPAVLLAVKEAYNIPDDKVIMSLFTAAGTGIVIARKSCISGAEGGCQAECGSASAMASAALVELLGGTPCQVANACAIALKNVMGLVCDPVAGLVEVPCIKRNASGAVNAFVATDLALAGIESTIPADEVIEAMKQVGDMMPVSLKETGEGGLANTLTGRKIADMLR